MASIKYGCIHPSPVTKEYPVAASQFFYHNGVNAVYLNGSGHLTLALSATATFIGIAIVPTGMGAGTSSAYWKSSATAGADKLAVILVGDGYQFCVPAETTITDAMRGNACDLIAVNDGTATTINTAASTTDMFIIQDKASNVKAGAGLADAIVIMNPAKVQADT